MCVLVVLGKFCLRHESLAAQLAKHALQLVAFNMPIHVILEEERLSAMVTDMLPLSVAMLVFHVADQVLLVLECLTAYLTVKILAWCVCGEVGLQLRLLVERFATLHAHEVLLVEVNPRNVRA